MWVNIPAYAYLALLLWVPLTAIVFSQMPTTRAALVVVIGGTCLLPELAAFDPPLLPPMDKHGIAFACGLGGMFFRDPKRIFAAKPLRGIDLWFIFLLIGAYGTATSNSDPFSVGGGLHYNEVDHFPIVTIPGLRTYDAVSIVAGDIISFWLPFFVGRALIGSREDLDLFVRAMAFAGVVSVPFIFIEILMSPQIHRWIYGYHAMSFAHAMRGGGFKPTLLLKGGLALAMFQYIALACGTICIRKKLKLPYGIPPGLGVVAIVVALLLSRSVGVLIYTGATLPLMLMFGHGMQLRVGLLMVSLFVSFPYTRATRLFPVEEVLLTADKINHHRYESLKFRFDNEDVLLERAMERPAFGWGYYGRNRVYNEWSGEDVSITDGEWVTHLGSRGYMMAIGWFGILSWPVLMAWRTASKVVNQHEKLVLGILGLALAVHAVDMLPNSSFNRVLYMFAGVVVGAVRVLKKPASVEEPTAGYGAPPPSHAQHAQQGQHVQQGQHAQQGQQGQHVQQGQYAQQPHAQQGQHPPQGQYAQQGQHPPQGQYAQQPPAQQPPAAGYGGPAAGPPIDPRYQ